jgi:hypothetical protein
MVGWRKVRQIPAVREIGGARTTAWRVSDIKKLMESFAEGVPPAKLEDRFSETIPPVNKLAECSATQPIPKIHKSTESMEVV